MSKCFIDTRDGTFMDLIQLTKIKLFFCFFCLIPLELTVFFIVHLFCSSAILQQEELHLLHDDSWRSLRSINPNVDVRLIGAAKLTVHVAVMSLCWCQTGILFRLYHQSPGLCCQLFSPAWSDKREKNVLFQPKIFSLKDGSVMPFHRYLTITAAKMKTNSSAFN